MGFDEWVEFTRGYADATVARACAVKVAQVDRWRRSAPPAWALRLADYELGGLLPPAAGAAWRAWRFAHDGLLYAPDLARGFTPGDLRQLHWLLQTDAWRQARAADAQKANGQGDGVALPAAVVPGAF